MPNVEIHGLHRAEARDLKAKIWYLFKDKPYIEEMVVTISPTTIEDVHGKDQPFLRLANSHQAHTREILETLGTLGMDIEHLKLEKFYPKGEIPPIKRVKQSDMD